MCCAKFLQSGYVCAILEIQEEDSDPTISDKHFTQKQLPGSDLVI